MPTQGEADRPATAENIPGLNDEERQKAAALIQKTYRGHRTRRALKGHGLDASSRWSDAVKEAQYQQTTRPRQPTNPSVEHDTSPISPAKDNWRRVTQVARRAGQDEESTSLSELSEHDVDNLSLSPEQQEARRQRMSAAREKRKKAAKMMDLAYFLEMVDQKHRHGSNLRKYHAHWKVADTNQSFFYWLDQGDGKELDLEECSRERLDTMQVRYLSREERLSYLVEVDNPTGLLVWAKNGERVWTKDELYKDSIDGIVPINDLTPAYKYNVPPPGHSLDETSSDESEEEDESTRPDEGEQYINEDFHQARGPAKIKHVSAGVIFNHMIRSSLKKGHKWIFVADTSFRLYIGYKQAGAFQHSSFLHGSRILAAGQIKVKHGQLRRLSPLSGHYRPRTENFRAFVENLNDAGVDMSRVSISQSYAVLVGLEAYTQTRKKVKKTETDLARRKDKVLHPEKARQEEEAQQDPSQSALKERQYLEQQRLAEEKAAQEAKAEAGKGPKARITRMFKQMRLKENKSVGTEDRGLPGSGPEDGIPPPEGPLLRR